MASSSSVSKSSRSRFYRRSWLLITAFILSSVGISTATVLLWQKSQANANATQTDPTDPADIHPTAIPWLTSESACEATGRHWDGEACWDKQHSPKF